MSEYLDSWAILLQILTVIGNIVLGYLDFLKSNKRRLMGLENAESHSQKSTIERVADWMVSHPTHGLSVIACLMALFLVAPFFMPSEYFLEAVDKILGNLWVIPLPYIPLWIAWESARIYKFRKDMENYLSNDAGDEN